MARGNDDMKRVTQISIACAACFPSVRTWIKVYIRVLRTWNYYLNLYYARKSSIFALISPQLFQCVT